MKRTLFETVRVQTLDCGLRVGVFPRPGFRRKFAQMVVHFGALDRRLNQPDTGETLLLPGGCAHFVEHQLFSAGGEDFGESFAALGADANAYTAHTETAYYFSCVDAFPQSLEALLRLVVPSSFSNEGVEREKQIIAHEQAQYLDEPDALVFLAQMRALYGQHPLAEDIAGTAEDLKGINADLLSKVADWAYRPANMCLVLVGDLDAETELGRVADLCANWERARPVVADRTLADPRPKSVQVQGPLEHTRLSWGWADPMAGVQGQALVRRELALELALDLCFGPSSFFYHRAYAEGTIDWDSFGYEIQAEPAFIHCLVGGETRDPLKLEQGVEESLGRAANDAISDRTLQRLQRKAYGHLVQRFDQLEACAAFVGRSLGLNLEPSAWAEMCYQVGRDDIRDGLQALGRDGSRAVARVLGGR